MAKTKCLDREEFVVVGWGDPEGSRHRLGSLLLGSYMPDGKLVYAGRAGTGMPVAELERRVAASTAVRVPPPRGSRFGSPLVLSRVHWVRPVLRGDLGARGTSIWMRKCRRMVCCGTSFTWVSASTNRLSRCSATDPS
jgi:ATP-dependent DNA ligase